MIDGFGASVRNSGHASWRAEARPPVAIVARLADVRPVRVELRISLMSATCFGHGGRVA